jgi:hypothetical protein
MSPRVELFRNGQRVEVTAADHPLVGQTGRVVRLRNADYGAWVDMDAPLPDELRSFPETDSRGNHYLLYPDECRPVQAGTQ